MERTAGGLRHPEKAVVLATLEAVARHGASPRLTIVAPDPSLKDDVLLSIDSALGDTSLSATSRGDAVRLSSVFDPSSVSCVADLKASDLATEPVADYVASVREGAARHRAFSRHVAAGVKLTSKPDTEEEVREREREGGGKGANPP